MAGRATFFMPTVEGWVKNEGCSWQQGKKTRETVTYSETTAIRLGKEQRCEINQADPLLRRDCGRCPIAPRGKTFIISLAGGVVLMRVVIWFVTMPELHHLGPVFTGQVFPLVQDTFADNRSPAFPASHTIAGIKFCS